ncbi:ribulose bisphosphate carboxylase small subunit [Bradyrhizobium sp. Ash2021]|uniref:ribulose bisphosphate carboxylase small subunit n=1 Tax=Bradyrhizobium sp. Ash2021 TaxID=2954771 RepID=UPI0035C01106
MRLMQGQFSFLPDLTDDEIKLGQGWAVAIEFTDGPHPRNTFWEMSGTPMFDVTDPAGVMLEVNACRAAHPEKYVKVLGFDSRKDFETLRMSFIVNCREEELGFELIRAEGPPSTTRSAAMPRLRPPAGVADREGSSDPARAPHRSQHSLGRFRSAVAAKSHEIRADSEYLLGGRLTGQTVSPVSSKALSRVTRLSTT